MSEVPRETQASRRLPRDKPGAGNLRAAAPWIAQRSQSMAFRNRELAIWNWEPRHRLEARRASRPTWPWAR